ncbi:MAG: Zn-dependent hydrolase [Candidatus Eisenbacteria bacterium]
MLTSYLATPEDLIARLDALASFTGPGPGCTRLVYDEHWCDAHRWLRREAESLGLAATCDAIGNLFVHDPAVLPGSEVILVGSHLDTVLNGGRYDGPYGALAAFQLAAELRGLARPVVAFVTCEEEGSRFPAALTGVRGVLGQLIPSQIAELTDADGVRWSDALAFARERGCTAAAVAQGERVPVLFRAWRQLELHIEQGPVLEGSSEKLGIVDRIAGYCRMQATLTGAARHAGTTPMDRRHDALACAAEVVIAAEALALEMGAPAVCTAGFVRVEPGLYNVVPGRCTLGLEARHTEPAAFARLCKGLEDGVRAVAARRGITLTLETRSAEPPTALDDALAADADALAQSLGIPHRRMPSGAGHDTMAFAQAGVPAMMLFVPSRGGISHSPDEHTAPKDLWTGVAFARELLRRWASEGT